MALQSSGQISLSEIAAEFGGSAPHSLSEYYGDGNAPASGEIQLAADFYGTSAVSYLLNTTVNSGSHTFKAGLINHGYSSSSAHGAGSAFGSIGSTAISGTSTTVTHIYYRDDSPSGLNGPDAIRIAFSTSNFTGFTQLIVSRADGSAQYTLDRSAGSLFSGNNGYAWTFSNGSTNPFSGQTAAIVQLI